MNRALPILCVLCVFVVGLLPVSAAQRDERAVALVEKGIAALGGPKFLAVTSITTTGVYTPFVQGRSGLPAEFVNVHVLPDRERTDFGKKKHRVIQSNAGDRGWKFDASRGTLGAQTEDEVRSFQTYARAELTNVLRTGWRAEGVKLRHLGRTEHAPRQWSEGVAVEYPDGLRVDVFFDAATGLPTMRRYQSGDGSVNEVRYHFYIEYDGVKVARTADIYRDGVQTGRIVNDTVRLNAPPVAGYFDQPADVKAIK